MGILKNDIEKRKEILYNKMDSEDYVTPNMLDCALDVIQAQSIYISELEKGIVSLQNI